MCRLDVASGSSKKTVLGWGLESRHRKGHFGGLYLPRLAQSRYFQPHSQGAAAMRPLVTSWSAVASYLLVASGVRNNYDQFINIIHLTDCAKSLITAQVVLISTRMISYVHKQATKYKL